MKKRLNTKSAARLISSTIPYFEDEVWEVCRVSNNGNTYILDVYNNENSDIKSLFDTLPIEVECADDTDPYSVSESSLMAIREYVMENACDNIQVRINACFSDIGIFLSEEAAKASGATTWMWHESVFQLHNPFLLFDRAYYESNWDRRFLKIIEDMWN